MNNTATDMLKGFFGLTVKDSRPLSGSNDLDPISQMLKANTTAHLKDVSEEEKQKPTTTSKGK